MNHFSLLSNGQQGQDGMLKDVREPVQNIVEIYRFDGDDFIREAYRNLYGREPDPHGMAYYLGRLAQGFDKTSIIVQMSKSADAKRIEGIPGLTALLAEERRTKSWFWGLFGMFGRAKQLHRQHMAQMDRLLAAQRDAAVRSSQDIATLEHIVQSIPWHLEAISRSLEGVAQNLNALQNKRPKKLTDQSSAPNYYLSEAEVCEGFFEILGRKPEDDMAIEYHRRHYRTYDDLAAALMKSTEFQSKASGHARLILKRMTMVCSAGLQGA